MKKNKIIKIVLTLALLVGVFAYLVVSSFGETMVYYKTVDELLADVTQYSRKPIRINGVLVQGSIRQKPGTDEYLFQMSKRKKIMNVSYSGIMPDAVKEDRELVVHGVYNPEKKMFEATEILTKCPSKYEAKAREIDN